MTRKLVEHPLFLGGRRASAGLPVFQSHNPPVEAEHAVALDVRRACRQERERTGKRAGAGAQGPCQQTGSMCSPCCCSAAEYY